MLEASVAEKRCGVDFMAGPSERIKNQAPEFWSKAMTSGEESYTLLGKQPPACYWVLVMMKFQNIWTPSDHTSGTFLLDLSSHKVRQA